MKENSRGQPGFTLIELLVVITIIGILAALALPNYMRAKMKAKEAEVKSNLHSIQISLERYSTDHSGAYPSYLIGGDQKIYEEGSFSGVNNPKDSLINYAYISSYPKNPFTDGTPAKDWTGNWGEPGTGDLRFGWNGDIMGNGFDNPRYFWSEPGVETNLWNTGYYASSKRLRYCWGGKPQMDRKGDSGWGIVYSDSLDNGYMIVSWPGNFGYRSTGDILPSIPRGNTETIWDYPYIRTCHYMLWAYGSESTQGIDIVRTTDIGGYFIGNSDGLGVSFTKKEEQYYSTNNGRVVRYSHPENFGGGNLGIMPFFPYCTNGDIINGAPDGIPDGIILLLTSSGQNR